MDLKIGNKVKLYNCEDVFIIEEIDIKYNYRIRVKKLKNNNIAWINEKRIEKII